MSLWKILFCQLCLFGVYKLFLVQVIEEHFVPNELTRSCLSAFVCVLCFGIQVYTDIARDDGSADTGKDPKKNSKLFATCAITTKMTSPVSYDAEQKTHLEVAATAIFPIKPATAKIAKANHPANLTTNLFDKILNKSTITDIDRSNVSASTAKNAIEYVPSVNGLAHNVYKEEDNLKIDHLNAEKTKIEGKDESRTTIKTKNGTVVKSEDEPAENSELSSNILRAKDSETHTNLLKTEDSTAEIHDQSVADFLNDDDNISSIATEGSQKEDKIGDKQCNLATESIECLKTVTESLSPEVDITRSSTLAITRTETVDKYNGETSLMLDKVNSSIEKASPSMTNRKLISVSEVYYTPVAIDISFIYACY